MHENKQVLNQHLDTIHDVMYDSPGYFYIKDLRGNYIYINQNGLQDSVSGRGFTLIGKTDHYAPWEEFANLYRSNDLDVLSKHSTIKTQQPLTKHHKQTIIITTHKKPFYCNDQLVGICATSLEVPLHTLSTEFTLSATTQFIDVTAGTTLKLTPKQKMTLGHLLKGITAKQIAERLQVSRRTIEHHIEFIKDKLDYHTTKEILLNIRAFN